MNQFDKFKEEFDNIFDSIYDFIEKYEEFEVQSLLTVFFSEMGLILIENNDVYKHDSYGTEESDLERIFYSKKYDIFVKLTGTRDSYDGTTWKQMIEVKPKTITKIIYEEVISNRNN